MMKAVGYRLLVKPKEIEKVSEGGIVIIATENEERLEEVGQQFGTVVSIGPSCWGDEEPWCKVGDEICFAKHAGRFIFDPHTGEKFFVMNDTDVLTEVTGEENE